jgi:putative FmdB family regulatory protein
MPIYEYQCEKCHHHLEALQKLSDKPLRECPECGKHSLKRLISAPMFRLAGSGWYETDFKSENERKRNLAGKDDGPPPEAAPADKAAKADASAEKKPEPKSDSKSDSKSASGSSLKSAAVKKPAAKPVAKPVARARPAAKKPVRKAASKR